MSGEKWTGQVRQNRVGHDVESGFYSSMKKTVWEEGGSWLQIDDNMMENGLEEENKYHSRPLRPVRH